MSDLARELIKTTGNEPERDGTTAQALRWRRLLIWSSLLLMLAAVLVVVTLI